jgi:CBS domain-containing protein
VAPHVSVDACLSLMTDKHIRHLPIMEDGALVGMLSIGDLVKTMIAEQQKMIEQLQSYITG